MPSMTGTTGTPETSSLPVSDTDAHIELNAAYAAHNYHPLRVVVVRGVGLVELDVCFGVADRKAAGFGSAGGARHARHRLIRTS